MKDPLYVIQVSIPDYGIKYVYCDPEITFVVPKVSATIFKSRMLAYGWMIKCAAFYRTYRFSVVNL